MNRIYVLVSAALLFSNAGIQTHTETTKELTALLARNKSTAHASHKLGTIAVTRNKDQFYVIKDGTLKPVHNYDVDKTLRSIPADKMENFLKHGYLSVNQLNNGDYKLRAHVRGNGGGPYLCAAFYWGVKSLGYGAPAAAATTIAIATLPATAAPSIAAGATTLAAAGATTAGGAATTVAVGSATIGGAAFTAGEVVVATVGTETVAMAASSVAASAGIVGYVSFVESAALAAGAVGAMIPFL